MDLIEISTALQKGCSLSTCPSFSFLKAQSSKPHGLSSASHPSLLQTASGPSPVFLHAFWIMYKAEHQQMQAVFEARHSSILRWCRCPGEAERPRLLPCCCALRHCVCSQAHADKHGQAEARREAAAGSPQGVGQRQLLRPGHGHPGPFPRLP